MSRLIRSVIAVLVASVALVPISYTAAQSSCSIATLIATPATVEPLRMLIGEDEALFWQAGPRAVVLVHGAIYDAESWTPQAEVLAERGFSVLSLERTSADAVESGIKYLLEDCGASGITLIGASAGVSGSMSALAEFDSGVDGLIVLAGSGPVDELGDYPKLFVASEEEGFASSLQRLAEAAPGADNSVLILPGSAHAQAVFLNDEGELLMDAIITFLEEHSG